MCVQSFLVPACMVIHILVIASYPVSVVAIYPCSLMTSWNVDCVIHIVSCCNGLVLLIVSPVLGLWFEYMLTISITVGHCKVFIATHMKLYIKNYYSYKNSLHQHKKNEYVSGSFMQVYKTFNSINFLIQVSSYKFLMAVIKSYVYFLRTSYVCLALTHSVALYVMLRYLASAHI